MCYTIVTKINTPPPRNAHAWNPQASKSVEGLIRGNALENKHRPIHSMRFSFPFFILFDQGIYLPVIRTDNVSMFRSVKRLWIARNLRHCLLRAIVLSSGHLFKRFFSGFIGKPVKMSILGSRSTGSGGYAVSKRASCGTCSYFDNCIF